MPSTTPITLLVIDGNPVQIVHEQATLAIGLAGDIPWSAEVVVMRPPRNWPPDVTSIEMDAGGLVMVGRGRVWHEVKATRTRLTVQIRIIGDGDLEPKVGGQTAQGPGE